MATDIMAQNIATLAYWDTAAQGGNNNGTLDKPEALKYFTEERGLSLDRANLMWNIYSGAQNKNDGDDNVIILDELIKANEFLTNEQERLNDPNFKNQVMRDLTGTIDELDKQENGGNGDGKLDRKEAVKYFMDSGLSEAEAYNLWDFLFNEYSDLDEYGLSQAGLDKANNFINNERQRSKSNQDSGTDDIKDKKNRDTSNNPYERKSGSGPDKTQREFQDTTDGNVNIQVRGDGAQHSKTENGHEFIVPPGKDGKGLDKRGELSFKDQSFSGSEEKSFKATYKLGDPPPNKTTIFQVMNNNKNAADGDQHKPQVMLDVRSDGSVWNNRSPSTEIAPPGTASDGKEFTLEVTSNNNGSTISLTDSTGTTYTEQVKHNRLGADSALGGINYFKAGAYNHGDDTARVALSDIKVG